MIFITLFLSTLIYTSSAADVNTLPDGFMVGAATAAYQVEGAWNEEGKGESIWDNLVHTHPEFFALLSNQTGDIADDSYHKYQEDIQALKDIGAQHYRFSISWPRIMPTGDITNINQKGIDYYNNLINGLLENDIIPLVTMYHFDLPQALQDLGGWANPVIADYFEDYARVLYTEFGDRVKWWITLNEPHSITLGYGMLGFAPSVNAPGVGPYLAGHTLLMAHAKAYHLYDENFRQQQQGKVSITLDCAYAFPKTDSEEDKQAAEFALQDRLGWFAHPIYSEEGDYPAVLKEFIGNQSKAEGRYRSRLPEFDDYWINYIKGTADFFALNHYSSNYVTFSNSTSGYSTSVDPDWVSGGGLGETVYYVPEGIRNLINWVSKEYNHPDIFITENGWPESRNTASLNDTLRIQYYNGYLAALLKAVHVDNSSVIGYTAWSLLDNIEWTLGDSLKFGLYQVDFNDSDRPRTPRASAAAFAEIIKTRQVPEEYFQDVFDV